MKLLAFDYGASSGRGILGQYDGQQLTLTEVHRFSNDPVQVGETLYWDVLRLYHELKQGILACHKAGHADLSGIAIDTWGVDFGLLDAKGVLLANPVHYRDDRTKGQMEKTILQVPSRDIYAITGIQFMEINTLYHMLALKEQCPKLLEQADTLLFIPDLLQYFLTGVKRCESTIASTSQMLDAKKCQWAKGLLEQLGLSTNMLLEIQPPLSVTGILQTSVQQELGVGPIPVLSIAGHDTASAVVAVPAKGKDFAYLSSGTWSLIGVERDAPLLTDEAFRCNMTNEGGINGTTRLLKNIMGLWILQECKRAWDKRGEAISFVELEKLARAAEPFRSLIDTDAAEFGKPGNMPEKVQEWCRRTGQLVPQTKGEIVRCVYESLAMKYRTAFQELEQLTEKTIPVLHIVGGGSKDVLLNQMTADAINRPVVAGPSEATAIGNLLCQLMALGEINTISEARAVVRRSFEPMYYQPVNTDAWNEAFLHFQHLLKHGLEG